MIQKLVVMLFLTVLTFALLGTAQGVGDTILKPHAPIYINGNSDFTTENGVVSGSGTEDDPYIIEGWEIDCTTGWHGHNDIRNVGILVAKTSAYFVIRKVRFFGEGAVIGTLFHDTVTHGRIEDCLFDKIPLGIQIQFSHGNAIARNTFVIRYFQGGGSDAVVLLESSNNTVYENTGTGGFGGDGDNNTFYGNTIYPLANGKVRASLHDSSQHDNDPPRVTTGNRYFYNNLMGTSATEEVTPPNHWDNATEGNYWSNFSGWDANGDGISDSPHKIEGGGVDRYPLMRPWKSSVVAMGIKFTGPDEFVTIANWSQEDVNLTGWKLQAVNPETGEVQHTLVFPSGCSLPKDGKLRVHSGPGPMTGQNTSGSPSKTDLYGQWQDLAEGSYVWNDLGGMVRIVNADGKVIDEYEYHWWMGQ